MIKISLKFVYKGPINNISVLVQIMAWCQPGDKPLSKPMMVSLPTHISVTRPQWVNTLTNRTFQWRLHIVFIKFLWSLFRCFYKISMKFVHEIIIHNKQSLLVVMTWCQAGDRPLLEPVINSLSPSDAIYWKRYWSTMVQIMAWCLMAPSHYLNQYWLEIIPIHLNANSQQMYKMSLRKLSIKNRFLIFLCICQGTVS